MAQATTSVFIQNNTAGKATVFLFHENYRTGVQSGSWPAEPGQIVGPLTVQFYVGDDLPVLDQWAAMIHSEDEAVSGLYRTVGNTGWQPAQLYSDDADKVLLFAINTTTLTVKLTLGTNNFGLRKIAPYQPITHVFVVMLENHSFDNIFALSGIPGIQVATRGSSNWYDGNQYFIEPAPPAMPADPGHEFTDVVTQLCGEGVSYPWGGPYPQIYNSGFVANYANATSSSSPPLKQIMGCFATPLQLPVIYQLATEFAICDYWYSSLPGPTFPNRFFVHGASSAGLEVSPTRSQLERWYSTGFVYPHKSIYYWLKQANIPYRFYHDSDEWGFSLYADASSLWDPTGSMPQAAAIQGVSVISDFNSMSGFESDLQTLYPYLYTFIEPHYGDVASETYQGGSSQHPMDDVYGGENLLWHVYSAIRNSPYWNTSLLIITYDEHGGFFDSVAPPSAPPPNDNPINNYNVNGFNFEQYGVRVPAVVVSPLIPRGMVDSTVYDHSSVLKTFENYLGLKPLTARDAQANDLLHLLQLSTPRTDCPIELNRPFPPITGQRVGLNPEEVAALDAQPLPESGNVIGLLYNLRKAEIELSGGSAVEIAAINAKVQTIRTRGALRRYTETIIEKIRIARAERKAAERETTDD